MTTEKRLVALERRNKYLMIGLVVLAGCWAFTSTTGTIQAQTGENIIQAERFELVDSQGDVRAILGMFESGPMLSLYDENGTNRAWLSVTEFGPGLSLYDGEGVFRAALAVSDELGSGLTLLDENETDRALLIVTDSGPMLRLYDEKEVSIYSAP